MRASITLSGLLLALLLPLPAAAGGPASLHDILEAAWDEDSEWRAARKTLDADRERMVQARGGLFPTLDASYSHMETDRRDRAEGTEEDYTSRSTSLSFAQPLFRPAAWYQYRRASAATSASEAQFHQQRQAFLLRVAEHYLDVLRAWDNLDAARAQERTISRQLEQTRESFDVGTVAVTDVHEAEAAWDLARVEVIVAESDFEVARDRLEAFTGRRWEQLAGLREEIPLEVPSPEDPREWQDMAREGNPEVVMARHGREAAQHESRERLSDQLPTMDFVAQYQDSELDGDAGGFTQFESDRRTRSYGIEVNMPLFRGGRLNSQRREAALRAESSSEDYRVAWRDAGQQALALHRRVSADTQRVQARRQSIRSAQSALRATESGYEVGTRNIVDLLNAQQNLFTARRDFANARYDYILNSLELHAMAGILEEEELHLVNEWMSLEEAVEMYE